MDIFDTRYFRLNRLLLSFMGLWPYEYMKASRNIFICCSTLGLLVILLPQVAFLLHRMTNLSDFYDVLPTFLGIWITILKTSGLHWQGKKFRMLLEHVQHDWYLLANHRDISILMDYSEKSRIFTLAFLIFLCTSVTIFVMTPLIIPLLDIILASNATKPKRLPHPTEFYVDMERYFYILSAITIAGYIVCAVTIVATDTIYFALLQHACGTLTILSKRLETLVVQNKSEGIDCNSAYKEEEDIKNMIQCIQLQVRTERLIHSIESTFEICLFADIGVGIVLQCSACVMIITRTNLVKNVPLLLLQSTRFFYSSWLGQRIIDHSSQISIAAYNGLWYQTSLKTKKLFLFLIMKCQKPFRITMAKLYVLCLESYSMLMKTSASFITVMLSLNSDNN
ncbi:odorant receptor 13a-like [Cardiocondyla obscurior]|uniref:odorant receptor 13a-like n=1 Tax=Cardiocondyla obscurior TaxID=286306 RepID=UPI00396567F0